MKMFCSLKVKTVVLCVCAVLCACLVFALFVSAAGEKPNANTAARRRAFISDLGLTVTSGEEKQKAVEIPLVFSDVYENYNALQKSAGYDLSDYRGAAAVLYSYPVTNAPGYTLNLLVYGGRVIGGDLSSVELSGRMVPLQKKEIEKCLN